MKKIIILLTILITVFAFMFTSCEKEKNKEVPRKSGTINMAKLPVYYNGVEMNCLLEDFNKPATKSGDMEEVSLLSDESIYIFDVDAAFHTFCMEEQSLEIYATNQKLDLIYAKAVELGLTEVEDEVEYNEIPQEMVQYWNLVFNKPIPEPSRNAWGAIFRSQYCYQKMTDFLIFWPSFGVNNNNAARSVELYGVGSSWLCTKTWFGGSKLYHYVVLWKNINTLSTTFDKKLCSHIGF